MLHRVAFHSYCALRQHRLLEHLAIDGTELVDKILSLLTYEIPHTRPIHIRVEAIHAHKRIRIRTMQEPESTYVYRLLSTAKNCPYLAQVIQERGMFMPN